MLRMNRRQWLSSVTGSVLALLGMNGFADTAEATSSEMGLEYFVSVNRNEGTLDVKATAQTDGSAVFRFEKFIQRGKPEHVDVSVSASATKRGEWEYEVDSTRGKATLSYTIQINEIESCQGRSPFMLLSEHGLFLDREAIFASPEFVSGGVGVTVDLPDAWTLYATEKVSDERIEFEDTTKLHTVFLMAGQPEYDRKVTGENSSIRHLIFPDSIPCTGNWARDFKRLHDLAPPKNAQEMQSELGFYISRFGEIFDQSPPPETIVSPDTSSFYVPDWGLWQTSPERRRHHQARHLGFMYDSLSHTDRFMSKDVNHYFADEVVYDYTGEDRLLGNRYFKFLVFTRGREIFTFDHTKWPHHNRGYAYQPVQAWYTDHLIKSKTDGEYSLKDVKAYSFEKRVDKQSVPEAVATISGVDISEEYSTYVLEEPASLAEKLPLIKSQYRSYFDALLDYQRLFSKAPDILLYSFIELVTRNPKGHPSKLTIMMRSRPYIQAFRDPDFGGISADADVGYVGNFYEELQSGDTYSRESFRSLLNKYTDGNSSDFFEFYGEHARSPSIDDLNYFLDGSYQKLLSKQLYVRQSVALIEKYVPKNRQTYRKGEAAKAKYQKSKSQLNAHELNSATDAIDEAISLISEARAIDEEGTGVPDLKAAIQGIDPDEPVDPSTLDSIHLDGYAIDWENAEPFETDSQKRVVEGKDSVFVGIPLSVPHYEKSDPCLELYVKDEYGNSIIQVKLQTGGEPLIPGVAGGFSFEEYVYLGSAVAEIEIPKSYLEYHGIEDPSNYVWQTWDRETGIIGNWDTVRSGIERDGEPRVTTSEREPSPATTEESSSTATDQITGSRSLRTPQNGDRMSSTTSPGFGMISALIGFLGGLGLYDRERKRGGDGSA